MELFEELDRSEGVIYGAEDSVTLLLEKSNERANIRRSAVRWI